MLIALYESDIRDAMTLFEILDPVPICLRAEIDLLKMGAGGKKEQ